MLKHRIDLNKSQHNFVVILGSNDDVAAHLGAAELTPSRRSRT
jgi:hypothetical protein